MSHRRTTGWKIRTYWLEPGPRFASQRVRRIEDTPAPYGVSRYQWWGGAKSGPVPTDLVLLFASWVVRRIVWALREVAILPLRLLGAHPWVVHASRGHPPRITIWRVYGRRPSSAAAEVRRAISRGASPEAPLRTQR